MPWRPIGLTLLLALGAALSVEAAAPPSPPARRETRLPVGEGPGHLAVQDVTGDGIADLLVCNERGASITVLLGSGQGRFSPAPGSPFAAGPNPNDLAIADLDGTSSLDLVVANHETRRVTVLLGDGKGRFAAARYSPVEVGSRPHVHGVAVADFNGDWQPDLVVESWEENQVEVLFNRSGRAGFAGPGARFPTGAMPYQRVRAADLNRDGHADIVTTNLRGASLTVLLADGRGGFRPLAGRPPATGPSPFFVALTDLDRDGHLDAVVTHAPQISAAPGVDGWSWLRGNGQGAFQSVAGFPQPTGRGPTHAAVGDLDGDGQADVVVSALEGGSVDFFLLGREGRVASHESIRVGTLLKGVAAVDLDGNGRAEVLVASSGTNEVVALWH